MTWEVFTENCLDTMRRMDAGSIDLTVTSPPYDNLRTYNGYTFDFEPIAEELFRVTKQGGVVVWVVNDATVNGSETGTSFRQALYFKEVGFRLHDTMIYKKSCTPFPDSVRYYQNFEYMFVLSKHAPRVFNPLIDRANKSFGRIVTGTSRRQDGSTEFMPGYGKGIKEFGVRYNVWEIDNNGLAGVKHPAVFPLALAKDHVISWSNPGDTIYDPFTGSGTTGVAALSLGRKFIGSEISEEYADMARRRIEESTAQASLIDLDTA